MYASHLCCEVRCPWFCSATSLTPCSPELFTDRTRDYTVYVLDPTESAHSHMPFAFGTGAPSSAPSSAPSGVAVGMGFMSRCLAEDDASVTSDDAEARSALGRVVQHPVNGEVVEVVVALQEVRHCASLTATSRSVPADHPAFAILQTRARVIGGPHDRVKAWAAQQQQGAPPLKHMPQHRAFPHPPMPMGMPPPHMLNPMHLQHPHLPHHLFPGMPPAPLMRTRSTTKKPAPGGNPPPAKAPPPPQGKDAVIDLTVTTESKSAAASSSNAPIKKRSAATSSQKPNLTTTPLPVHQHPMNPYILGPPPHPMFFRRSNTLPLHASSSASKPAKSSSANQPPKVTRAASVPKQPIPIPIAHPPGFPTDVTQLAAIGKQLQADPTGAGLDPNLVSALREAFPDLIPPPPPAPDLPTPTTPVPAAKRITRSQTGSAKKPPSSSHEAGTAASAALGAEDSIPMPTSTADKSSVTDSTDNNSIDRKRKFSDEEMSDDDSQPRKRHNASTEDVNPAIFVDPEPTTIFAAPPATPSRNPAQALASLIAASPNRIFRTPVRNSGSASGGGSAALTLSAMFEMFGGGGSGGGRGAFPASHAAGNQSPLRFMARSTPRSSAAPNTELTFDEIFNSSPFRALLSSPTRRTPSKRNGSDSRPTQSNRGERLSFGDLLPPSSPLPPTSSPTRESLQDDDDDDADQDQDKVDSPTVGPLEPAFEVSDSDGTTLDFSALESLLRGEQPTDSDGAVGDVDLGQMWELFAPLLRENGMLVEDSTLPNTDEVQESEVDSGHPI